MLVAFEEGRQEKEPPATHPMEHRVNQPRAEARVSMHRLYTLFQRRVFVHASWPTTQLIGKRTVKYGKRKLMEKLECSLLLLQEK